MLPEFIELTGASGARYRFRREEPDRLAVRPGNFAFLRQDGQEVQVVVLGAANELHDTRSAWVDAVERHDVHGIYIYLNTTRRARQQVHHDLVASFGPIEVAGNLDG